MISPSVAFLLVLFGFSLIYGELLRPGLVLPAVLGLMGVVGGFYMWFAAQPAWPGLVWIGGAAVLFLWEAFAETYYLAGVLATAALAYGCRTLFSGPARIGPGLSISGSVVFAMITVSLGQFAKRARGNKRLLMY